jgi:hypothetical protein
MKYFFLMMMTIRSLDISAETIKSRIHKIEDGFIKFENGRVAFFKNEDKSIYENDYIHAEVDEHSNLISYVKINHKEINKAKFSPKHFENFDQENFEPSIVPSLKDAQDIFNRSNPYYKRVSECSDRAHVWAHEELKFSGTKSMKAFIFFTASYINSVRFKWWFHVAPLYRVNDQGNIKDLVMDFRYTDRPLTVKEWSDQFVFTKRSCKVTTKFSEYDVNPQTENCYLIFESMHYKIPAEIHEKELSGKHKTRTSDYELKTSYRYAFQPK